MNWKRRMVLQLVGVSALVAGLGACTLERGETRVWTPGDPDPKKANRVMQAMLQMDKIDIAKLEQAYQQAA